MNEAVSSAFVGLYYVAEYFFFGVIFFLISALCLFRICFYFKSSCFSEAVIPSSSAPVDGDVENSLRQRYLAVFNQRLHRNACNIDRIRTHSHHNIYSAPPGVAAFPAQEENLQIPPVPQGRNSEPVEPVNFDDLVTSVINENSRQNPEADLPPSYDTLFPGNQKS